MPEFNEHITSGNNLLRVLLFGPPKVRKTWLAGTAAEAGFNVLFLDGEGGTAILRQIAPEARKRIYVLDIQDTMIQAKMAIFMSRFCKGTTFYYDEKTRLISAMKKPGYLEIRPQQFDSNTVVVLDSYTALAQSIAFRYSIENKIDLSDAEKTEWDGYGWAGLLASWMLEALTALPCHFIMIAHADMYEKFSGRGKERKLVSTRMQIKSTSRPHAGQICNKFDDVIYMRALGSTIKLDCTSAAERDGGTRNIAPKVYTWAGNSSELDFAKICEATNCKPTQNFPTLREMFEPLVKPDAKSVTKPDAKPAVTIQGGKAKSLLLKSKQGS